MRRLKASSHLTVKASIFVAGLTGAIVVLWASSVWGIGIGAESEAYVLAAASFADGHGLKAYTDRGEPTVLTEFAPFYSVILGVLDLSRLDPIAAARWVSAICFGVTIILAGLVVRSMTTLWWPPVVTALFTLVSVVLNLHLMALSEHVFFVFKLATLSFFLKYFDSQRSMHLVLAAAAAGLALLTRFAGVFLVPAGVLILLRYDNVGSRFQRVAHLVIFVAVSCLPALMWMAYTATITGNPVARELAFHPVDVPGMIFGWNTVSTWLLPGAVPAAIRMGAVLMVVAAVGWSLLRIHRSHTPGASRLLRGSTLALIFVGSYLAMLIVSASFLDNKIVFDDRTTAPIYIPALILIFALGDGVVSLVGKHRLILGAAAIAGCLIFVFNGIRSTAKLVQIYRHGVGWTGANWHKPTSVAWLKSVDPAVPLYSNQCSFIRFFTSRAVSELPAKAGVRAGKPNNQYNSELKSMIANLETKRGVILYFTENKSRDLPSVQELTCSFGLRIVASDNGWVALARG